MLNHTLLHLRLRLCLYIWHMVCGVSRSSSLGSTPVRSKMTTRTWKGKDLEVQCEAKAHGAAMRRAILRRSMQTGASCVGSAVARLGELKLEGGFWCIALSWKRVVTYKVVHGWLKLAATDTEITFALVLQNQVCATTPASSCTSSPPSRFGAKCAQGDLKTNIR